MQWRILTISLLVYLLTLTTGYAAEVGTESVSVAEQAFTLRLDGKSQQARDVLCEYLKEDPNDAAAHFEYSRTLAYLFKLEDAEKHAALAAEKDAENPRYRCWQGTCAAYLFIDQAHHKKNYDPSISKRSIGAFQEAVRLDPNYHFARYSLVSMLNNNPSESGGDRKQARKHTQYLMQADLDYGLQATMVVDGKKSLDWKIEQYRNALAKEPDNAGLLAQIALLYVRSDQMDDAQKHIDKALELDTKQKDVLLSMTLSLSRKKDLAGAKAMTQRYLGLAENEPAGMRAFASFYLAKIEKLSGNPDADKMLKRTKQIDPDVWMTMMAPPAMLFEPLK